MGREDETMSDRENAFQLCLMTHHDWVEEYYGYRCSQCHEFIPYGCEPWAPVDEYDYDTEADYDETWRWEE